jgi:heme exporter protein D
MPDLGPHAAFIIGAYAVAFVVLGVLTLVTVANDRKQRRILIELERKGIRRRSAAKPPTPRVKMTKSKPEKAGAKRKPARAWKTRS